MTQDVHSNQPGRYSHQDGRVGVAEHGEQHYRAKGDGNESEPCCELVDLHDILL
jgi:hypothetical protein